MTNDYFLGLSKEGFHRVVYTEWGTPHDAHTPIICVHGLTRNNRDFDDLAIYLSQRGLSVFCPDIVGRGESDWLNNPLHYTHDQYLSDMTAMIARINRKQVDWIGTSMGGLIGMVLASLPKSPIRRLILNDIGAHVPTKGILRIAQYAGKEPVFSSINEAKEYYKTVLAGVGHLNEAQWQRITENSVREISPGKFVAKLDQQLKLGSRKKMLWQLLRHPIKALKGSLYDIDLWDTWRNIRCPVLVLHGKESDILLPSTLQKMQQIHSRTDVIEIPDAGHAPALFDEVQHKCIYQWLSKND